MLTAFGVNERLPSIGRHGQSSPIASVFNPVAIRPSFKIQTSADAAWPKQQPARAANLHCDDHPRRRHLATDKRKPMVALKRHSADDARPRSAGMILTEALLFGGAGQLRDRHKHWVAFRMVQVSA